MASQARRFLNVGGGKKTAWLPDYLRTFDHCLLDIDPKGAPDILCDARELSSQEPDQFDAVYCSHNLEHYYAHDVQKVLQGFLHVLKPGGFAEVRVPDIGRLMHEYVARGLDIEDEVYTSGRGPILVRDMLYGFGPEIEESGQDFYSHKTGFTQKSLSRALEAAGFGMRITRLGRQRELLMYAFTPEPTAEHVALLDLKRPNP